MYFVYPEPNVVVFVVALLLVRGGKCLVEETVWFEKRLVERPVCSKVFDQLTNCITSLTVVLYFNPLLLFMRYM